MRRAGEVESCVVLQQIDEPGVLLSTDWYVGVAVFTEKLADETQQPLNVSRTEVAVDVLIEEGV